MSTLQPPPPPQKTGNAQVDAYLERLYKWSYLFWFHQTNNGQDVGLDLDRLIIPGLDGEDGEDGFTIIGPQGPQGVPGVGMPGADGQDAEDWNIPSPVRAPDSERLEDATWSSPKPIGSGTANTGRFSTVTATGAFGCNSQAAQTAYASGGTLNAYGAGTNGFDTAGNASALHAMVVAIRAALVANGIMS